MRRNPIFLLIVLMLALLVTAACSRGEETPAPTPTRTLQPTFTPTPVETPTPLPPPTDTPLPTDTPEPTATDTPAEPPTPTPEPATPTPATPVAVIDNPTLNVRRGPGTNYAILGRANNGERYDISGSNQGRSWYQINYNGQDGWVSASFVIVQGDANSIQVAANIPVPPPPTPTPIPPPTPVPQPTAPPAPPAPSYAWQYAPGSAIGAPQCGVPNLEGQVRYRDGSPQNGVCVLIDYYGPRQIKYSGSGGKGDGNWGFSPCGSGDCTGTLKVYVVQCPPDVPDGGLSVEGGIAIPERQSDVFEATITDKCTLGQWTNIIFQGTR